MWIKVSDETYVNTDVVSNTSVVLLTAGGHSGDYALKLGSFEVAYFSTQQEALDALAELMATVGTTHVEGTA